MNQGKKEGSETWVPINVPELVHWKQTELFNGKLSNRYKLYEMYDEIRSLLKENMLAGKWESE